jgi:hypothetical protein
LFSKLLGRQFVLNVVEHWETTIPVEPVSIVADSCGLPAIEMLRVAARLPNAPVEFW